MKSLITLQRKDGYILKGAHDRGQLSLLLTNTIEGIQFTLALADLSLNEEAKSLFGNTENIWICLSESSDYEVIPATGILLLKAPRRFPILKLRMARGEEGLPQAPEKD